MKPLVSNAGDEAQVKAADKEIKERQRTENEDVKWVLSSKEGRRFYWQLMGYCHVFGQTFTGEALVSAHNEGKRVVGLRLLTGAMKYPNSYLLMMNESRSED